MIQSNKEHHGILYEMNCRYAIYAHPEKRKAINRTIARTAALRALWLNI